MTVAGAGAFPLKLIETTADQALETWQELKAAGQGAPVVLVGDDWPHAYDDMLAPDGPDRPNVPFLPSIEEILRAAAAIENYGENYGITVTVHSNESPQSQGR